MLFRNIAGRAGGSEGLGGAGSRRGDSGLTGGRAGEHGPCDRDQANFSSVFMVSAVLVAATCSCAWRARAYSSSDDMVLLGNS